MQLVQTAFSRLTLCDDGILEAQPLKTKQPRTGELLNETLDAIAGLTKGESHPVLWKATGTLPLRPGGWQAIVGRVERLVTAIAIVVTSEEEPLLGAFPATMDSLLVPVRVFTSEAEARAWLLQFVASPGSSRLG